MDMTWSTWADLFEYSEPIPNGVSCGQPYIEWQQMNEDNDTDFSALNTELFTSNPASLKLTAIAHKNPVKGPYRLRYRVYLLNYPKFV